jgi:uncharacterized protein YlxP (DUF503 family)
MIIALLHFELLIHGAASLKDKRSVVKSVKDRLHREHMVAVAEVGSQEILNRAVLALTAVGTDGQRLGATLDRITEKLRGLHDAELGFAQRELLRPLKDDLPEDEPLDEAALAAEMLGYAEGSPDTGRPDGGEP